MNKNVCEIRVLFTEYGKAFADLKAAIQETALPIKCVSSVDKALPNQGILWITDKAREARELVASGEAVLFYLREGIACDTTGITYCIEGFEDVGIGYLEQVYCHQRGLPWYVLETERLYLREITTGDVKRMYELYADEDITKYMEDLFATYEEELVYTQQYIRHIYGFYGYGMWVVVEKESGEVIGRAGIESREGFDGVELGFMLGKAYQHKGYAYEICKAILEYGAEFLGLEEYCAWVMPQNTPSVKLLEKLGFTYRTMQKREGEQYLVYDKNLSENRGKGLQ